MVKFGLHAIRWLRPGPRHHVRGWAGAIVVAMAVLGGCASGSPPAQIDTITIPAPRQVGQAWLDYLAPPRANVLLPAGYDPHRRYPLVVFLNGLDLNYSSYARFGLTQPFDDLGAIVVMPEGGNGWYTDWWNNGLRADPSWESYELDTVIPTILADYPILPQRRYHALIGISMGGLGAAYLGGRLPGFFGSVATLSGFVDPQYNGVTLQAQMSADAEAVANGDRDLYPIYGPPEGFYARGHNPLLLAKNLDHTRVFESTGTGVASKATPRPSGASTKEEATVIHPMNVRYHRALVAAGVGVTYQVHAGTHSTGDFLTEINSMLAWGLFKPVVSDPASWTNETVATSGQLWDLDYRFSSPPTQVVRFRQSGATLAISAAGSDVTITTGDGCTIRTSTPATVHLPSRALVSPRWPERVGQRSCR